jgi:hypothetical protein
MVHKGVVEYLFHREGKSLMIVKLHAQGPTVARGRVNIQWSDSRDDNNQLHTLFWEMDQALFAYEFEQ